jgi:putative ATPase
MDDQGSLFGGSGGGDASTPLAERMRPKAIDAVVGQERLIGPGTALRRAIDEDRLHSLILWGPPGSGKTTLARVMAHATKAVFAQLSAVTTGIKDAREVMEAAVERRRRLGQRTVLFIDEIHRYNKAQQDAFLPYVERGDVVLIGATTENPSFGIIGPLLSRARTYVLEPLPEEALRTILRRALEEDVVLAPRGLELDDEAAGMIAAHASGDARGALNLLEVTAASLPAATSVLTKDAVRAAAQSRTFLHDKKGEQHYDVISAFIKSMRNSDPDAAMYWMARLLAAGEDPLFILRRMVVLAAEDIGLADPQALQVAVAAQLAFERIGLPEGEIPMAQACIYLATAPKSNASYCALLAAREAVANERAEPVPLHLRNAPTGLMRSMGYGRDYRYAHDEPEGVAAGMSCLPPQLAGRAFYQPTDRGHEASVRERLERWRALRERT